MRAKAAVARGDMSAGRTACRGRSQLLNRASLYGAALLVRSRQPNSRRDFVEAARPVKRLPRSGKHARKPRTAPGLFMVLCVPKPLRETVRRPPLRANASRKLAQAELKNRPLIGCEPTIGGGTVVCLGTRAPPTMWDWCGDVHGAESSRFAAAAFSAYGPRLKKAPLAKGAKLAQIWPEARNDLA